MTYLLLKILGLMLLAAGFGAWLARWFFRHRYEDVTVQYTGWQNEWAQWRKGLDAKLSLRQMLDLSPVTERLGELEALVRGFGMPKPPPVDLAPVLDAIGQIKYPDPPSFDFTPLYSRMYEVEQRVGSIKIPPAPDLMPLHQRLDGLEAALQRSVASIPTPQPTDLAPVMQGLHALDARMNAIRMPDLAPVMTGLSAVVDTSRADLAPLYARLSEVDKAVRDLPRPAPVDLAPLMDRMAAIDANLGASIGAIRIPAAPPATNLQPVQARLESVERAIGAIRLPSFDLSPVQTRLGEIEQSLKQSLSESVAAIPAPVAPKEPDFAPLLQRFAALEAQVAAMKPEPVAPVAPVPPVDLGPLHTRLDALERAVAGIQLPAPIAPKDPDFTPVMERLAQVEARIQRMPVPPTAVNLTPLQDKLDVLSRAVGAFKLPPPAPVAPPIDLGPLRGSLEQRFDTLERAVSGIRIPVPVVSAPVDLSPLADRLRGLELAIGKLESNARNEAMTLRRTPPTATRSEPVAENKAAASSRAPASAPVNVPVSAPLTSAPQAKPETTATQATPDPQLGLVFDSRHVREGSRNLLTHQAFGKGDDLQDIVGVAAGMETLLHKLGVYYFWQIAEWTPEDVAYVDSQLTAFRGRITREQWVKQCVKLAVRKGAAKKPG